jgi:hypothetical protein
MQRHRHGSRYGPEERESSRRRPYGADEDARRSARDEFAGGGTEDDDERRTSFGEEWPERYRGETGYPRRFRDSWSERQSGPYRSASSGRSLSEDDYRQESRYYRSEPYTGFAGRVSEYGYEDPSWDAPSRGRQGAGNLPGSGLQEDYRGRGPKQYARSDQRIKEDICDELSDDHFCDAREIEIEVTEGKVTLSGSVPSRHMKHRAEDIADRARGVKDVDNRIRVERSESSEGRSSAAGARYTVSQDGGFLEEEASKSRTGPQRED